MTYVKGFSQPLRAFCVRYFSVSERDHGVDSATIRGDLHGKIVRDFQMTRLSPFLLLKIRNFYESRQYILSARVAIITHF